MIKNPGDSKGAINDISEARDEKFLPKDSWKVYEWFDKCSVTNIEDLTNPRDMVGSIKHPFLFSFYFLTKYDG